MTLAALQADCKRAIAQLRYLNNEELDHILQDNDRLTAILGTLDQVYHYYIRIIIVIVICIKFGAF